MLFSKLLLSSIPALLAVNGCRCRFSLSLSPSFSLEVQISSSTPWHPDLGVGCLFVVLECRNIFDEVLKDRQSDRC